MRVNIPVDDTDPEIERRMIEGMRKMTPADKLQGIMALNALLETMTLALLRKQYPDATDEEYRMRLAARRVPADLLKKAVGWDVEVEGY
jgi:hypothetical protein